MFQILLLSAVTVAVQGDTVCYQELNDACYTNQPPWGNTEQRPFSILPDTPENVNTNFYLDTRSQKGLEVYFDDMNSLGSFNPNSMTRFIVHGYTDRANVAWMVDMSDALLAKENANVIRVGWFGGSGQVNYMSAAVDTQIVGTTAGIFIQNLMSKYGMSPDKFHCIGHSLGAHTCGYVGNTAPIGRITGLDPAGPYFTGTGSDVQLDSGDASFVDVIHSDAETLLSNGFVGLGIAEQSGNVDFWPNDGRQQPGCDQNALSTVIGLDGVASGARDFVACNHQRAVSFFTESINSPCFFESYPCLSYSQFEDGRCLECDGTGCPRMGFNAIDSESQINNDRVHTYLSTKAASPFCEYMSYIGIRLGTNSKSIDGSLYVTVYGDDAVTEQEQIGGSGTEFKLQPGGYYSDLVYYDYNPGPINYVKVLWDKQELNVGKDYITVDYVSLFVGAEQKTLTFCGDTSIQMKELTRYTIPLC